MTTFASIASRLNDQDILADWFNQLRAAGVSVEDFLAGNSTLSALAPSRMTQTQRDALVSPPNGAIIFNTTTNKLNQFYNGTWTLVGSGAGSGGIDYISNPSAESDTAGYNLYADAAATKPVDGTGGTPAGLTFTRNTTSPLRAPADFSFAKDAVNRQGEGVSIDFTIDRADQGKVLTISADYAVSGTYADGDVTVWIYDVTNAVLIPVSAASILNTTVFGQIKCEFQTAINSLSYRLIFHIASTSASAWTLKLDNISVGPAFIPQGTPITDPVAYTPIFTGFGIVANVSIRQSRVGNKLMIEGRVDAGTATAVEGRMSLPSGLVASSDIATLEVVGFGARDTAAATSFLMLAEPGASYLTFGGQDGTFGGLSKRNGNDILSACTFSFQALVPIAGWSSSTQMSSDADTRVVSAILTTAANITGTGGSPYLFPVVSKDTHGAYNPATGIFTAPLPGVYTVIVGGYCTSVDAIQLYKNGSFYNQIYTSETNYQDSGSIDVSCVAGDELSIVPAANTNLVYSAGNYVPYASFKRLSGPAQIAASELVAATVNLNAAQSIPNTTDTVLIFDTKEFDTHGIYDTGTGTITIPSSGKYRVDLKVSWASNATSYRDAYVYVNGSIRGYDDVVGQGGGLTAINNISKLLDLRTGDSIQIKVNQASGGALNVNGSALAYLSISREGI